MRRVSVVGNSGSGKTTLAAELAAVMDVPHLELDSIFHQPGWQPLPARDFQAAVAAFTTGEAWVVDGNYSAVRGIVWHRADTVVWLDPPRHRVMRQLVWRTVRRMAHRTTLWNGNREPWANLLRADPQKSIIAWAWTHDRIYRERYLRAQADPAHAHLEFIRLRTPAEVALFTRRAATPTRPGGSG